MAAALVTSSHPTPPILDDVVKPTLDRILSAIRRHLGMDVAFISEFVAGRRYFRHVDAGEPDGPVQVGGSNPLEESYCARVVDGRLPELMTDACLNAEALTLAATRALPVGAHLSVPLRLRDGSVYGTFCCFSRSPNDTLNARDLGMMRVFADMVVDQIQTEQAQREAAQLIEAQIDAIFSADALRMVYQPIYDVEAGRVVGFESLARFAAEPYQTPDVWFSLAAVVGREIELESRAIELALVALDALPPQVYLSVNASPETIVKGRLGALLAGHPLERIVVEVTEHRAVERYEDIAAVVAPLQAQGLRIAIDDAGAGYASFRHILNLHPEIVKLDTSITRAIDADRSRRALAAALRGFASETGCSIVAEGIETHSELATLLALGISRAQGYHLGRPMPLEQAKALRF
jgi:EAL domain-containing protein (putative c-di-GMP-specific phosphodiesterase class I)